MWSTRFKPWLVVVMLAVLVAGSTGLRPARLVAQAPEPVIEDEPWVQEVLAGLCAGDIACPDPGAVETALRDCVKLTGHGLVSPSDARLVCRSYGERARRGDNRPPEEIERRAFATADAEVAALAAAGGIDELTAQLRLGLIPCLLIRELEGGIDPFGNPRTYCPGVYRTADDTWREATAQVFFFSRLAEGVTTDQAADELTRYDNCLKDQLLFAGSGGWSASAQTCRDRVLATSGTPQGGITCTPSPLLAGAPLTCTFEGSTEIVASYQWSAPGGTPSSGQASSLALRYDTDGSKQVELTACRTADPTSCAVFTTTVVVQPNPPTVRAVACAPLSVEVNRDVSCSATEENALTSASRGWTAPDGDSADGRGPTFATRYGRPGSYTITYRLCNGSACAEGSASITVVCGPTTAAPSAAAEAKTLAQPTSCPTTPPLRVSITTDRTSYTVGDPIRICVTVSETGRARLLDRTPAGQSEISNGAVPAGQTCITGTITPPTGTECIRLEFFAPGGAVVSAEACFEVRAAVATRTATPAPTATQPAGSTPASCSWTGTWRVSSEPDLVLTQSGATVTGTFGFRGTVRGTVSGDTFTGTATSTSNQVAQLEFRMNTTIDTFTGQYRPTSGAPCDLMSGKVGTLPRDFRRVSR